MPIYPVNIQVLNCEYICKPCLLCEVHDKEQVESSLTAKKVLDFSVVVRVSQNPGSAILELLQLCGISCPAIISHYVTIIKVWMDYRILDAQIKVSGGTKGRQHFRAPMPKATVLEILVMCVFQERCRGICYPRGNHLQNIFEYGRKGSFQTTYRES